MDKPVNRRDFLNRLGVTVGAAAATAAGAAGYVAGPRPAGAAVPPKGNVPDKPVKFGHMTFLTGPGASLGIPMLRGHTLAAEEINAEGGFLGKRKIETITADEAAGTDGNVKEFTRMKLSEGIDFFSGIVSSGNSLALCHLSEQLKFMTFFIDGCSDRVFEVEVPNPKYTFRVTNILSSDAISCMIVAARTWSGVRRISHVNPDYAYGRFEYEHAKVAGEKLYGGSEVVSEGWPKLFTTDFSPHITKILSAKPDLVFTSLWGGDYVAFYKQGLRLGLFDKVKFVSNIALGGPPGQTEKDHPEGVVAGVHANYHFSLPSPLNKQFVERYHKRWKEYPSFESEGAYTAVYLLKAAIEKANKLVGGWPDDEAIITTLEGLTIASPAGYIHIRQNDHQGLKDVVLGYSKNVPEYPFPVWDPDRIVTFPITSVTAPPGWPRPGEGHDDPSAVYNWIKETWPTLPA